MMPLPKTMKRTLPGLHAGPDLRASKEGRLWFVEAKLRDVGDPLKIRTNIYEASAAGAWMIVGSYARLELAEEIGRRLRAGTHMLIGEHSNELGRVPSRVVPFSDVAEEIAWRVAARDAQ